jgi:glycosyltransferase involved in cell wall biosynthesis
MRRVLVLAYFFPPIGGGGCQRTLKLTRYLEPAGWLSTVVTTLDSDYWILDPTLLDEVPRSVEVIRVQGYTALRALRSLSRWGLDVQEPQGARRSKRFRALRALSRWMLIPDGYRGWAEAARRASERRLQAGGVDALWTTSSPESAHLAGLALKRRHGLPWVADFRDPWVGRVTYRPPTALHDRAHRAMERSVVAAADHVTVVSEAMAAMYRSRYPDLPPERFVLLPNGFDPDDWRRADSLADASAGKAEEDRDRFVLLHAGQLAHRPTVRTLLLAARRVLDADPTARDQLRLRFLGGNEELDAEEPESFGLAEIVELRPSRPHLEALAAMRRAQALVLLGHGGNADSLLYTGKIYEYLSSGRPVLGIVDRGPCADLIRAAGAGPVLESGDVEGAARAIRTWLVAWRGGTDLGVRVPVDLLETWNRAIPAARAAELLSQIASGTTK